MHVYVRTYMYKLYKTHHVQVPTLRAHPPDHRMDRAALTQVPYRHCISLAAASIAGDDMASAECVHFLPCHARQDKTAPVLHGSRTLSWPKPCVVWHKITIIYLLVHRSPTTLAMF